MQQSFDAICRRAGGRRRYNKQRQQAASWRRLLLLGYLERHGRQRGTLTAFARAMGVHRSTITRDLKALHERRRRALASLAAGEGGPHVPPEVA